MLGSADIGARTFLSAESIGGLENPRSIRELSIRQCCCHYGLSQILGYRGGAPIKPETQHSKRILIVDDSEVQAKSLGMLLELLGHEVRLAYDGPGALEMVADFHPEVALIDVGLPGMNGYELARQIRQQPQFQPIMLIAQTGWSREEDRERSREAGFDHHLAKPIDHKLLQETLAALLVER